MPLRKLLGSRSKPARCQGRCPLFAPWRRVLASVAMSAMMAAYAVAASEEVSARIAELTSTLYVTRQRAVADLRRLRDPVATEALAGRLAVEGSKLGAQIAAALVEMGDSRGAAYLLGLLARDTAKDPRFSDERCTACNAEAALAELGALVVEPLVDALGSGDPSVVGRAALLLTGIDDGRATAGLDAAAAKLESRYRVETTVFLADGKTKIKNDVIDTVSSERIDAAGVMYQSVPPVVSVVRGGYRHFIARGRPELEPALVLAMKSAFLTDEGEQMARDFMGCGNALLQSEGLSFLISAGYKPHVDTAAGTVRWGEKAETGGPPS